MRPLACRYDRQPHVIHTSWSVWNSATYCKTLLTQALALNTQQTRLCQLTYLSVKRSVRRATASPHAGAAAPTLSGLPTMDKASAHKDRQSVGCQTDAGDDDVCMELEEGAQADPARRKLTDAELAEFQELLQCVGIGDAHEHLKP